MSGLEYNGIKYWMGFIINKVLLLKKRLVTNKINIMNKNENIRSMIPAGFWRRFFAMLIDNFIILTSAYIVVLVYTLEGSSQESIDIIIRFYMIIVGSLYFILSESSSYQGTVGKKVLGIKVTGVNGEKIGIGKAIARHIGKLTSALILMIGYLMVAFTKDKQALHDLMSDCLVIKN